MAAPGCPCLFLAAPGCFWLLPAAPGCFWLRLAASGCSRLLLATPGCAGLPPRQHNCLCEHSSAWLQALATPGRARLPLRQHTGLCELAFAWLQPFTEEAERPKLTLNTRSPHTKREPTDGQHNTARGQQNQTSESVGGTY